MPKLTDRFVANFAPAPGAKDRMAFDTEIRGLGIRATAKGGKTFLVQWTDPATGRKVREPLGSWGALTVEKAREAARIRLGRLAAGFDPKAEREAKREEAARQREEAEAAKREAAFTLEKLIADWTKLHLSSRRKNHAQDAPRQLRNNFARQLQRPASSLTHEQVLDALDALLDAGKRSAASHLVAYGRACFNWALKRRLLTVNPFAGLPGIEGGKEERDRVLNDAEVGEVWRAAERMPAPHGPMVRFLLLTLARREEVAGMTWSGIAADLSAWTQPAARTKNGRPHVVHLSEPARAVLREMLGVEEGKPLPSRPPAHLLVFGVADNKAVTAHSWVKQTLLSHIAAERAEQAAEQGVEPLPLEPWHIHDFRRTGVTWLAGAGFPPHVADKLLNHVSGTISGVAAVYQRNEFLAERKAALEAWGGHVVAVGEGQAVPAKVTDISAVRKRRGGGEEIKGNRSR